MCSPALLAPRRSLEQLLDDLVAQLGELPLDDKRRGKLAADIRQVEAALDERGPA